MFNYANYDIMKKMSFIVCGFMLFSAQITIAATLDMTALQQAAENGDSKAQLELALRYELGKGIGQDYHKAREWYEKAAEQGNAKAQYFLGEIYFYGKGVKQDYQKAKEWYEKAAKQGNDEAQYLLASLYEEGRGVKKTITWLKNGMKKARFKEIRMLNLHLAICITLAKG